MSIEDLKVKLNKNEKILSQLKKGMNAKVTELNDKYQKEGEQLLAISNQLIQVNEVVLGILDPYITLCELMPKLTITHEAIKNACNSNLSDLLTNCEKQVSQFKQIFNSNNDNLHLENNTLTHKNNSKLPTKNEIIDYITKTEKENNKSIGPIRVFNYFYEQCPHIEQDKVKKHVKKIIDKLFETKQLYHDKNSLTTDSSKVIEKPPVTSAELLEFINSKLEEKAWVNTIEIFRVYGSSDSLKTAIKDLKLLYTSNQKNLIVNEEITINESITNTIVDYIKNNQLYQ